MHRQQQFENSDFYKKFCDFKKRLGGLDVRKADKDSLTIYSRVKKVVALMEARFSLADFDLITNSQFSDLISNGDYLMYMDRAIQSVTHYSDDPQLAHMKSLNGHIDDILPVIQDITAKAVIPKKQTLLSIYSEYKLVMDKLISEMNAVVRGGIQNKKRQIEDYHAELLEGDDENPSKKEAVDKAYEEITGYHAELLEGDEGEESVKASIEQGQSYIREKIQEIAPMIDELGVFYAKIKGGVDEETGEMRDGFEHQLDVYKSKIKEIETEIWSLMDKAASVGLAQAFRKEAKNMLAEQRRWTRLFGASVATLFGVIVGVGHITGLFNPEPVQDWGIVLSFIKTMSFVSPLIWFAIFCAKRRSEANRLYHEYLHKEVVATSYISYKAQIEKLGDDEADELLTVLMQSTIETITRNPSDVLDKEHGSDMPATELSKKLRPGKNDGGE